METCFQSLLISVVIDREGKGTVSDVVQYNVLNATIAMVLEPHV